MEQDPLEKGRERERGWDVVEEAVAGSVAEVVRAQGSGAYASVQTAALRLRTKQEARAIR